MRSANPSKSEPRRVTVNCHGCKYQSKHYVPKNSVVTLEIPRMEPAFPPRVVQGHVVWVQRPRTVRELFQIGLELEITGNVWGIAFPPDDWFPYPDEAKAETPALRKSLRWTWRSKKSPRQPTRSQRKRNPLLRKLRRPRLRPSPAGTSAIPVASPPPLASSETKIHVMPSPAPVPPDAQAGGRAANGTNRCGSQRKPG